MKKTYFKGYWMLTNRCNLSCSYCVLENAPHQKRLELDLNAKKELIAHLYQQFNFRSLTLSGGEVLIIGKKPPHDFIELMNFIRQFRSANYDDNLEIEVYTNGIYMDENVINAMDGVVDRVAMTIDSEDTSLLNEIGRKYRGLEGYYQHTVNLSRWLTEKNIAFKLHSVISQKNHLVLPQQVKNILTSINEQNGKVESWKFYQYMSYDAPEKDNLHVISSDSYQVFKEQTETILAPYDIKLHFKDNKEMNASLFNILSYGNAQYMLPGDTWLTSRRTEDLRTYQSLDELFEKNSIDQSLFHKFHEIQRCPL